MASENEENMIVGLDIGTSKIVAIVGSIGAWLRPKIINTQKVFEKRGMVF